MHGAVPEVASASARLAALLRGLPLEGVERSFKMARGAILGDRLLAGFGRDRVGTGWTLDACRQLGMPSEYLDAFAAELGAADVVHLGCEVSEAGVLHKAYLEFPRRLAGPGTHPRVLHVAWKWDAAEPSRRAVARYRCLPDLTLPAISGRIKELDPGPSGTLLQDVAALCAARSPEPLMYLEVGEEGNPRASFDLNVHAAGLALREVEPQLRGLRAHFDIPVDAFEACFGPARAARLGHLSGGRSRSGAPFATIYYGGALA